MRSIIRHVESILRSFQISCNRSPFWYGDLLIPISVWGSPNWFGDSLNLHHQTGSGIPVLVWGFIDPHFGLGIPKSVWGFTQFASPNRFGDPRFGFWIWGSPFLFGGPQIGLGIHSICIPKLVRRSPFWFLDLGNPHFCLVIPKLVWGFT